jgi:aspartyl-tRNA(Asn)/glutamyl-tRNA(Gln) amidotransferase subunit A
MRPDTLKHVPADPADLGVVESATLLRSRELSSSELVTACLRRIEERDGTHSADGDATSINAWVRVYPDDALRDAAEADTRLTAKAQRELGLPPPLLGVPIGLKDLYAVAGKPLTASSTLYNETPDDDSDAWRRLRDAGMVLLGHTHTHEFAAGGTTDQVGNPWSLDRSAGGSSGGAAAALAARMVPAATGTDTAGSLRIPSALCATSTIKPTRNLVSISGVVPLAPSLDHCGPMARSVVDCAALLTIMAGPDFCDATTAFGALAFGAFNPLQSPAIETRPLGGVRIALSQRAHTLDDDVRAGLARAVAVCEEMGGQLVEPTQAPPADEPFGEHGRTLCAEMLAFHHRFDDERERYRPSTRDFLEVGERAGLTAQDYLRLKENRRAVTRRWWNWFESERIDAVLEPTVPVVALPRGPGYDAMGYDAELVSLTYLWDWTGFPVVSIPAGVGAATGLPVGVSLIGRPATDRALLAIASRLQQSLGIPTPPLG